MVHYRKHIIDPETGLCEICHRGLIYERKKGKKVGKQFLYTNQDGKFQYRPSHPQNNEVKPRPARKTVPVKTVPAKPATTPRSRSYNKPIRTDNEVTPRPVRQSVPVKPVITPRPRPVVHEEPVVVSQRTPRRSYSPPINIQLPPVRAPTLYHVDDPIPAVYRKEPVKQTPRQVPVDTHPAPTRATPRQPVEESPRRTVTQNPRTLQNDVQYPTNTAPTLYHMNGGAAPPPQTVYQKAPPQTTYQKEIVNAGAPTLYHMNGGTAAPPPQTVYRKEPVREEPPPQRRTITQNPQTTYQKEIVNAGAPTLYHMNGGTTAPPPQTVYRKEPVREESPPPQRRTVTQNPRTLQNDVQYPSNTAPTLYHMNGGTTAPPPTVYQKAPPQTVYKKELLTADAPTLYHMNGAPPQTVYQKEIVRDTPQPRYVAETPQPTRSRAQTPPRRQNNPNTQNTERPYVIQPANSYTPQPPPKVNMYHLDEPNDVVRYTPVNPPSSRVNPQQEPYRKQQQPLETVKPKQTTEPDLTVVRRVYKKLPPTDDEQIPNENYAQPIRKVQQTPREYTASPQLTNRQIINPIPNQNPSIYYIQNTNAY